MNGFWGLFVEVVSAVVAMVCAVTAADVVVVSGIWILVWLAFTACSFLRDVARYWETRNDEGVVADSPEVVSPPKAGVQASPEETACLLGGLLLGWWIWGE
jgi:hypothetical protein